eukprot:7952682-Pyramimonas_sp.AAC.1
MRSPTRPPIMRDVCSGAHADPDAQGARNQGALGRGRRRYVIGKGGGGRSARHGQNTQEIGSRREGQSTARS